MGQVFRKSLQRGLVYGLGLRVQGLVISSLWSGGLSIIQIVENQLEKHREVEMGARLM